MRLRPIWRISRRPIWLLLENNSQQDVYIEGKMSTLIFPILLSESYTIDHLEWSWEICLEQPALTASKQGRKHFLEETTFRTEMSCSCCCRLILKHILRFIGVDGCDFFGWTSKPTADPV